MSMEQLSEFEKKCLNALTYGAGKVIVTYLNQFIVDVPEEKPSK